MVFAGEKSEADPLQQRPKAMAKPSQPGLPKGPRLKAIQPTLSSRFLGVWLDWRLDWKAHREAVERKLKTQDFAPSRIAAKTWGPVLAKAWEVYTKCIRSA
jgi:hypothetical protein